ncbi:ketopantoate reductase family protein [Homoserinibacter sp. YIM 151385]|uniref:ketopantoate reductase family protein n=1 Tax=Homoserinibacter sp. YIM 151385 TaxID=2985506 RepID=UPI0022F04063|nr:2-dehydropantoate 2-reductase [Homoserinibacter sp. YIM 151385]WBU38337.1 2-dehydropantoate 2-reductase [Homoserinibacter sp. YIM 151385]
MRIGIIGAGAVGGTLAALLDRAGHEIQAAARGAHLAAIREGGLRLEGAWGEHTARIAGGEVLASPPELAIIAVKAQDGPAAIRQNADALSGAPLLVVQNGLDGIAASREAAPGSAVVAGLAGFAASFLSPGSVRVTTPGPVLIGTERAEDADAVELAARALGEVLPVVRTPDIRGAQWTKLLINHVNALPAITGLSVQETVAHPGLRRILTASMRESVRIARRRGVRFQPLQGLDDRLLRLLGRAPLALGGLLPRAMARRMGEVPNPASTLQSIRRGQPSEIDHLNGAIVREAELAGTAAPVAAALVALVHQVEATGRFVPAELVAASVPLGRD